MDTAVSDIYVKFSLTMLKTQTDETTVPASNLTTPTMPYINLTSASNGMRLSFSEKHSSIKINRCGK